MSDLTVGGVEAVEGDGVAGGDVEDWGDATSGTRTMTRLWKEDRAKIDDITCCPMRDGTATA